MVRKQSLISGAMWLTMLLLLILSSCAHHYTKIPRQFSLSQTKKNRTFPAGHFVQYPKKTQLDSFSLNIVSIDSLAKHNDQFLSLGKNLRQSTNNNLEGNRSLERVTNRNKIAPVDSITKYNPPRNLQIGAITLFTFLAGSNVVYLIAPSFGFLFIGFLIGVGLLTIGFILSKFISNAQMNRIIPEKIRLKGYRSNSSLKKAFKILMLLSGIFFAVALICLGLFFYELSFVLAVLGLTCLYAGLLVGLISLATSF